MRKGVLGLSALSGVLALGVAGVQLPSEPAPDKAASDIGVAMAAVATPKLKELYVDWADAHDAQGGDRNIAIELGRTDLRGHGEKAETRYTGKVRLNAIDGQVSVEIYNLPDGTDYEAWLIDDRPGATNSMQVDASDDFLKAGPLTREGQRWTLTAELGPEAFEAFQVDQVVIVKQGTHPTDGALAMGRPELFQRLYTALRTPELFAASDYAVPQHTPSGNPVFGFGNAFAARVANPKPIEVDPDVVLNDLVQLGADVFINENFDGNGRTCETCHPFVNNITIDPSEIARRPDNDPIFLAEQNPAFGGPPFPLDIPQVLRGTALIGIPDDGLDLPSVQRSVPHLFAISTSRGPVSPVVLPFGSPMAPPTPFPLPDPNDPNDPGRMLGLDIPLPPAGPELSPNGTAVPGGGFPAFGFTVDNGTNPPIERLGFGGDLGFVPEIGLLGRLGDAVPGAVITLLTKTPNRVPGVDFRFPTPQEVDAVVAFYLTLGRSQDLDLASLQLSDPVAERGRLIFRNPGGVLANFPNGQVIPMTDQFGAPIGAGKCDVCHSNAGARANQDLFQAICAGLGMQLGLPVTPQCGSTNFNFETGVDQLPSQPARVIAGRLSVLDPQNSPGLVPADGGFGLAPHIPGATVDDVMAGRAPCFNEPQDPNLEIPSGGFGTVIGIDFPFTNPQVRGGSCSEEFNTPPLVEAADTGPFFHNNNASTIEGAVEFYNTSTFRRSSAGVILGAVTDGNNGINLENTEVQAIASFLRVINALENLRSAREFAMTANSITNGAQFDNLLTVAISQTQDAAMVLEEAKLNARQVDQINRATELMMQAQGNPPVLQRAVRGFFFFRRVVVSQDAQPNQALVQAIARIDQAAAGLQQ